MMSADIHMCGQCRTQFTDLGLFTQHKQHGGCRGQPANLGTLSTRGDVATGQPGSFNPPPVVAVTHGNTIHLPVPSSSATLGRLESPATPEHLHVLQLAGSGASVTHELSQHLPSSSDSYLRSNLVNSGEHVESHSLVADPDIIQHYGSQTLGDPVQDRSAGSTEDDLIQETAEAAQNIEAKPLYTLEQTLHNPDPDQPRYSSQGSSQSLVVKREILECDAATLKPDLTFPSGNNMTAFVEQLTSSQASLSPATANSLLAQCLSQVTPDIRASMTSQIQKAGVIINIVSDQQEQSVTASPTPKSPLKTGAKVPVRQYRSAPPQRSEEKAYLCNFDNCSYSTAYAKDLLRHKRSHTGEKPFSCKYCDRAFKRSDKLAVHVRTHTGVKPYRCEQCDYACTEGSSLRKHLRIHSDERPYKCQICSYAARNSSQLTVHLRTHTGDAPFTCTLCQARFKVNSDLKRHWRLHTGEKPFQCDMCEYRCSVKSNLKSHKQIFHCPDKMVKCDHCEFATSSKKAYREHMRLHSDAQLFYCDQCSYNANSLLLLNSHLRSHRPERPFKCTICTYSSRQKSNLHTHMTRRHPDQCNSTKTQPLKTRRARNSKTEAFGRPSKRSKAAAARPFCKQEFGCSECDATFVREDSLRSHQRCHQQALTLTKNLTEIVEAENPDNNNEGSGKEQVFTETITASCPEILASDTVSISGTNSGSHQDHLYQIQDVTLDDPSTHGNHQFLLKTDSPVIPQHSSHPEVQKASVAASSSHAVIRSNQDAQMARNLQALIENNQNMAVEDNLQNLAVIQNQQPPATASPQPVLSVTVLSGDRPSGPARWMDGDNQLNPGSIQTVPVVTSSSQDIQKMPVQNGYLTTINGEQVYVIPEQPPNEVTLVTMEDGQMWNPDTSKPGSLDMTSGTNSGEAVTMTTLPVAQPLYSVPTCTQPIGYSSLTVKLEFDAICASLRGGRLHGICVVGDKLVTIEEEVESSTVAVCLYDMVQNQPNLLHKMAEPDVLRCPRSDSKGVVYIPSSEGVAVFQMESGYLLRSRTLTCGGKLKHVQGVGIVDDKMMCVSVSGEVNMVYVVDVQMEVVTHEYHPPESLKHERLLSVAAMPGYILAQYGTKSLVLYSETTGTPLLIQLDCPGVIDGLNIDNKGHFLICNSLANQIFVLSKTGGITEIINIDQPRDISVGPKETLLVAKSGGKMTVLAAS